MDNTLVSKPRWTTLEKIAFRFFAVYWFIYIFYSLGILAEVTSLFAPMVALSGKILNVQYEYIAETGSGDTTYDYLLLFCFFWISVSGCIVWSAIDRKRASYNKSYYWLLVALRYCLGMIMIGYGCAKIFYSQFTGPDATDLVKPLGEMSPMGLAWRFMGYSYAFNLYTGLAEALGGFLLFFRRTTTFGALFCMTVLSTVVAMNFCFDIPVKLFSSHLMLMAIFIAAPAAKKIMAFFFSGKAVALTTSPAVTFSKKMNYARVGVKVLVVGAYLTFLGVESYEGLYEYGPLAPHSPLEGIYNVQYFIRNNDTIPPLLSDTSRWQQLIVAEGYAIVKYTGDKKGNCSFDADTVKKEIKMLSYQTEDSTIASYTVLNKDQLRLYWLQDKDTMQVLFKKKDLNDYVLMNRGFNWVNEFPYNR